MTEPIKLPPLPNEDGYTSGPISDGGLDPRNEADRQANQITGETSDGYHTFNELYAHRVRLFCLLMHAHKGSAWWSRKHHDGSAWEGWVIAGIDTPEGSITYHLPESEIENLPEGIELPNGKEWDGNTSGDVLVRLLSLRQARGEPVAWISDSPTKGNGKRLFWAKTDAWRWSSNIEPLYTIPQIPEGYKLVPVEPTIKMCDAALAVQGSCTKGVYHVYRAMLEAAPEPKEKP